jgi:hypothetical protein
LVGDCFIAVPSPTETSGVRDHHVPSLTFTGRSFMPGHQDTVKDSEGVNNTGPSEYGERDHWITGNLRMNVVWAVDPDTGVSLGPRGDRKEGESRDYRVSRFSTDPLQQIGPAGSLSIRKLMVLDICFLKFRTGFHKYVLTQMIQEIKACFD